MWHLSPEQVEDPRGKRQTHAYPENSHYYSKHVFTNINRTEAAKIDLDLQTLQSTGPNMSSV